MIITVPVCNDCNKPHFGRSKKEERCCCDTCGNYSMKEITEEEYLKSELDGLEKEEMRPLDF